MNPLGLSPESSDPPTWGTGVKMAIHTPGTHHAHLLTRAISSSPAVCVPRLIAGAHVVRCCLVHRLMTKSTHVHRASCACVLCCRFGSGFGGPWGLRTLGLADPGGCGPWGWRTLGMAGRYRAVVVYVIQSVCLSQVSTRAYVKTGGCKITQTTLHHSPARESRFLVPKNLNEIQTRSLLTGTPNAGGLQEIVYTFCVIICVSQKRHKFGFLLPSRTNRFPSFSVV